MKKLDLKTSNNSKKYNIKAIQDNAIYVSKAEGHLPSLYYLVAWKSYLKEIIF